jgi:hypothetical protein
MRLPFVALFELLPDGSMRPRKDVVIGKASFQKGVSFKSSSLASLKNCLVELDGDEITGFVINGKATSPHDINI